MPAPHVSVIVPTYSERDNLAPLAQRLFSALDGAPSFQGGGQIDASTIELLIVDDDSPDGTADVARQLSDRYPIRCLVRRHERGLATAVIHGLRAARGELCVVMDADLSHPPETIPSMLALMRNRRVRMVIGSRFVRGGRLASDWPFQRRLNSFVARLLAWPLTQVADMMSGFFCVRRADLHLDRLRPIGYKIALELIVRHGWTNVVEVPITFCDRTAGVSKLNLHEQLRYLHHLGRLYLHAAFGHIPGHP